MQERAIRNFYDARNQYIKERPQNIHDPWKMFVNATKACAAVIAVLLGAIATSVLLPWRNTGAEGPELLRYSLLCAYMIMGMLAFVLMPLLARSLDQRRDRADLQTHL